MFHSRDSTLTFKIKLYNEGMVNVALSAVLGWLFGLLSPSIVKKISEKKEKANLEKIVFNDLKELKKRLAPLAYTVYPKYGKLDEKTFNWLKINSGIDFSEGLEQLAEKGHTEEQVLAYINENGRQKRTLTYFKKMHLFATDSHLMNFGLIDSSLVASILEVRFHVEAFNEDIDSFREHLKMTFLPGMTVENHGIITREIENKSLMIAEKSMFIVDKINTILNPHGERHSERFLRKGAKTLQGIINSISLLLRHP